jgi:hypothetical protein
MKSTRLRRTILPFSLLLLLFLYAFACVPTSITDLRPIAASRVTASSLPPTDRSRDYMMNRGEAAWKVSLIGDANWMREVRQHELNSYATVLRCDDRDKGLFSLGPYVGKVRITYYDTGFRNIRPPTGRVTYDIYVPETGSYSSHADINAPMPDYDLSKTPMTLCISIGGGAMTGVFGRSNEVRVRVGSHT